LNFTIHRTPFFLPWIYPDLVWRIPTDKKELFLTFDDGPVPGPTEFVLDTLKQYSIKATFFCIGDNVRKHPDVFKRIVDEGHAVGNHTFNHLKGWSTSLDKYVENINRCEQEFSIFNPPAGRAGFQFSIKLFRPPYGRITKSQIRVLKDYKIIMWDVLTADYQRSVSPQSCLHNSIAASRPGSIIVFHDSVKAERNLTYALPRFIEYFLKVGYSFNSIKI
jgi:peptidoglycan/xylan/chitin deacetylase (PgdA/CDA1 family)